MTSATTAVSHGLISVIGRRRSMEDAVTVAPSIVQLPPPPDEEEGNSDGVVGVSYDYFAVYDGHGGNVVAHQCKERFHDIIAKEIVSEWERRTRGSQLDWERVMVAGFSKMDEEVLASYEDKGRSVKETVGSTAMVAVVGVEEVVVAHCGHCRSVLCSGGTALALSRDHKLERPDEKERVEAARANVVNGDCSRVLGVISPTRSIGDRHLKPFVISEPEVTVHKRTESDAFLLIASDGLWDVVSNEVACKLTAKCFAGQVRRKVMEEVHGNCAAAAATVLAELAIARGSRDNISVIVVELQKSSSWSSCSNGPLSIGG